jgi:hypothetical protein
MLVDGTNSIRWYYYHFLGKKREVLRLESRAEIQSWDRVVCVGGDSRKQEGGEGRMK